MGVTKRNILAKPRTDPTGKYIYDTHLVIPSTARESWPVLGYPLVIALVYAWYNYLTLDAKLRTIVAAVAFAGIEYNFYSTTIETVDGDILLRPFDPRCRKGHTTWHQFFANIIFTPLLLDIYFAVVPTWPLRVLLFPFNVWLLEIVEGYVLMYLYGYNPAWTYRGTDAYFHNNIKLGYWYFWLGLGAAVELIFPFAVQYTQAAAAALMQYL
ncbi:uncharacterized protein EV422DRAFT_571262 [Fimicolochytrium jonesii]|uniref:uncharacterized protein n=1 Tax=Fimicolochytrium jonesii TaxID=1396493 RepID=UPI0022FDC984|nr:uncharacterized protein EV422DRAFT_571262 [Fimicolochytrium jonesii]KAI8816957.1 hypothetical protein EV422DRAFT_571262 [Fimicolochytrium jonesii]